jgi:hypothetical protein
MSGDPGAEQRRLDDSDSRRANWQRWGPYLSERQWSTVREDYSADGDPWSYLPHDHARSRAYRWGEDGLLGICDRECRLCFALALWNGRDPILKERLFGLTGHEGNHSEDVKECYYYLDSTPTHSYMKALYKYPHAAYPYRLLVDENRRRGRHDGEFELLDSGVFDHGRYCDIVAEYAKAGPDDILIRLTVANRAAEATVVHLLPTLWCRNTWSWGANYESDWGEPEIRVLDDDRVQVDHASLGSFVLIVDRSDGHPPPLLFTGNETNALRLFGHDDGRRHAKDSFHAYVVDGRADAVDPRRAGTKMAAHYLLELGAGEQRVLRLRLCPAGEVPDRPLGDGFDAVFAARIREADEFYATPACCGPGSSTTTTSPPGSPAIRASRGRPNSAARVATATGPSSSTATSCRCPTSGSTPGTRPGTSPST